MLKARLVLLLMMVGCFCLATWLGPRHATRIPDSGRSGGNMLKVLAGDGKKLFADHMFAKADAYFHRGRYPSIFERAAAEDNHLLDESDGEHHEGDGHDHGADEDSHDAHKARGEDWIRVFGGRFSPNAHVHLERGNEREMLPWLRLSVELDPQRVQTYGVAAYWLRERLGKVDEAEQFLREGLKANPRSPELLFELGKLQFENRKDLSRARNLLLAAVRNWRELEQPKPEEERDELLLMRILGTLSQIEREAGNDLRAVEYLRELKAISPDPDQVQKRIDALTPSGTP